MSALTNSILQSEDANEQLKSWLHDYARLPGVADELIDADGRPRSHWMSLLETLSSLGEDGLSQHFSVAGRRIKEMGVTYRVRGEERERGSGRCLTCRFFLQIRSGAQLLPELSSALSSLILFLMTPTVGVGSFRMAHCPQLLLLDHPNI